MFGSINGKIVAKTDKYLLVEVGGLGYRIYTTEDVRDKSRAEQNAKLFLHTHVREDALDLYGFANLEELNFFELLISVSGIGPKGALGVLNVASTTNIKKAIRANDISYLTKVSGIGRKTAEKICLELRDKLSGTDFDDGANTDELDVLEALKALGYKENDSREILHKIGRGLPTSQKIKEALKMLSVK